MSKLAKRTCKVLLAWAMVLASLAPASAQTGLLSPVSASAAAATAANPAGAESASSGAEKDDASLSSGEVRKVDKEAGKLTIRHGELKNLDMPPMTMVFRVSQRAMLDAVQPGDMIRFQAEKIEGLYTVTELRKVKP